MNTIAERNSLPPDLISRAQLRLIQQGYVPESPGVACGSTVRLCVGTILVCEAVALYWSKTRPRHSSARRRRVTAATSDMLVRKSASTRRPYAR